MHSGRSRAVMARDLQSSHSKKTRAAISCLSGAAYQVLPIRCQVIPSDPPSRTFLLQEMRKLFSRLQGFPLSRVLNGGKEANSRLMGRIIRCLPREGCLVEVTCRTLQGRFLLRPSPQVNEIILGILARAQRLYPLKIHYFVVMSNHMHLLVTPSDQKQLSDFMGYAKSNIAREIGRVVGWKEKIWGIRYRGIPVSTEESAQVGRLRYLLSHGLKEGLVDHPAKWPGLHPLDALLEGKPLVGQWFNRTKEYAARIRGEDFDRLKYASRETLNLSPLPCWASLPEEAYRSQIAFQIQELERKYAAERASLGKEKPNSGSALSRHPHHAPKRLKKSPSPRFHTASQRVRRELLEGYALFLKAYRSAAEKLKNDIFPASFPAGCFPPGGPFIRGLEARAP